MKVRSCLMATFVLVVLGFGTPAWAQTDEEHFQTFPFNFSAPGARPSAMGGAFIGLANDASAAVTNPAGLTFLTKGQIYGEFRSMYSPVIRLAQFDSLLTGFGDVTSTERTSIPGFINLAIPIKDGRAVVAFSMHQYLKYSTAFTLAERRSISNSLAVYPFVSTNLSYSAASYIGSVGFKVNEKLRVGFSGSLGRMSAYQTSVRKATTVTGISVPNTSMNETDYAFGLSAGLLYDVHKMVTVGLSYTKGPSFTMTEYVGDTNLTFTGSAVPVRFKIPDRWGIGLAFKPHPRYNVLFDVVRVNYSQLAADTKTIYYAAYNFTAAGAAGQSPPTPGSFFMNDATEYHGGLEAKVIQREKHSIFARVGIFTMAPHNLQYAPPPAYAGLTSGYSPTNPLVSTLPDCSKAVVPGCYPVSIVQQPLYAASQFYIGQGVVDASSPTGLRLIDGVSLSKTDLGVTFGGGVAVGGRFQVDFAYAVTNNLQRNEVVVSTAIRF